MISKCTPAVLAAAAFSTVFAAGAQTNPVNVKSPDGALELSIATMSGNSPSDGGGHSPTASFRGKPVLDWSTSAWTSRAVRRSAPPCDPRLRDLGHDENWSSPQARPIPFAITTTR